MLAQSYIGLSPSVCRRLGEVGDQTQMTLMFEKRVVVEVKTHGSRKTIISYSLSLVYKALTTRIKLRSVPIGSLARFRILSWGLLVEYGISLPILSFEKALITALQARLTMCGKHLHEL